MAHLWLNTHGLLVALKCVIGFAVAYHNTPLSSPLIQPRRQKTIEQSFVRQNLPTPVQKRKWTGRRVSQQQQSRPISLSSQRSSSIIQLWMGSLNKDDDGDSSFSTISTLAATAGIAAQPIVWISLYCVATTGGGLPAGPFGLLGLLEGLSYLAVAGFCGLSILANRSIAATGRSQLLSTARALSSATFLAALLVVAKLVLDQGCIPNAKPILDYSEYVPVCDTEQTPGLFGR